jgi:hypothetical protein
VEATAAAASMVAVAAAADTASHELQGVAPSCLFRCRHRTLRGLFDERSNRLRL